MPWIFWTLPCLVPQWPQIMQIRISFRSRSDLVLDADHALDFLYPISFYRRVSRFVVFQTKWRISVFVKSWFSGRGWGQQLFTFQSPAVHWIARTASLNCLSCRNPYQTPHSLNCLPPFHWKALFFAESASSHPLPKNRLQFCLVRIPFYM